LLTTEPSWIEKLRTPHAERCAEITEAWNRLVEVKDDGQTASRSPWNNAASGILHAPRKERHQTLIQKNIYDALGRRVKKHVDSQALGTPDGVDTYVHMYYNTGWQLLETRETDTESTAPDTLAPEYQFVWSARYIDAPILREDFTVYGVMDGRIYYLTDANFNVTALVDEVEVDSWQVVERYMYDAYGVVTVLDGCSTGDADNPGGESDTEWDPDPDGVSDYLNPILYCGYYRDLETGLYHVRMRPYHAHLGRWTARDLLRYVDGMSLYEYVMSKPTVGVDSFGLNSVAVIMGDALDRQMGHMDQYKQFPKRGQVVCFSPKGRPTTRTNHMRKDDQCCYKALRDALLKAATAGPKEAVLGTGMATIKGGLSAVSGPLKGAMESLETAEAIAAAYIDNDGDPAAAALAAMQRLVPSYAGELDEQVGQATGLTLEALQALYGRYRAGGVAEEYDNTGRIRYFFGTTANPHVFGDYNPKSGRFNAHIERRGDGGTSDGTGKAVQYRVHVSGITWDDKYLSQQRIHVSEYKCCE